MAAARFLQAAAESRFDDDDDDEGAKQRETLIAGVSFILLFLCLVSYAGTSVHHAYMKLGAVPKPGELPVRCGHAACKKLNYVPVDTERFVCFSCGHVSRIPSPQRNAEVNEQLRRHLRGLPERTGPLKTYKWQRKGAGCLYQLTECVDGQIVNPDGAPPEPNVLGREAGDAGNGRGAGDAGNAVPGVAGEEAEDDCCQICMDAPSDVILRPCAHGGMCLSCIQRIVANPRGVCCPICRCAILMVLKIDGDIATERRFSDAANASTQGVASPRSVAPQAAHQPRASNRIRLPRALAAAL